MSSEWQKIAFSEAVLVNPGAPLVRGKVYPFVEMAAVNPGSRSVIMTEPRMFLGGGSRFKHGDTLMARITPCLENGKIARFYTTSSPGIGHGSTEFIVIRGRSDITDTDFAYYLTQWDEVRNYAIGQMTGTSGRQRVPTESLDHLIITLPPLTEQRAIAYILGTLDDKIELNRRMNETLEAMARALFKSWFVDFDPVRAKAEGRWKRGQSLPGLPAHLYDLFPDSFEDSELGEIPKGWKVECVNDEFNLTMGQSPPGETYNKAGEGIPFYQGRTDFGFRFPIRRIYCTAPTRFAKQGDTLISVRAPVGDINMASEDCAIGRGVAAARHRTGSRYYTFQFMCSKEEVFRRFEAEGTVFGSIGKKDLYSISCIVPPRDLVLEFERMVTAVASCIESTDHETLIVSTLRETLLPKLILGELCVKDAERFVKCIPEEVTGA